MRVAEAEDHAILLTLGLVAHSYYIKLTDEPVGNPGNRVLDQRASEPVHRSVVVRLAFGDQLITLDTALDAFR